MGGSYSHELALQDACEGVDNLGRVVEDLAKDTARGLQITNQRLANTEQYVQQMLLATAQGFAYCDQRITRVESRLEVLWAIGVTLVCVSFMMITIAIGSSPQCFADITAKACEVWEALRAHPKRVCAALRFAVLYNIAYGSYLQATV